MRHPKENYVVQIISIDGKSNFFFFFDCNIFREYQGKHEQTSEDNLNEQSNASEPMLRKGS